MKEIPLTKGYIAKVDDEDYERLSQFKWCAAVRKKAHLPDCIYAISTVAPNTLALMHRFILGCPASVQVDHWDTDGLNNQRYNLRQATPAQNGGNARHGRGSSQFKGVSWNKAIGKWECKIANVRIGFFVDECDAATAYNFAAEERFGAFARFNTPKGAQ